MDLISSNLKKGRFISVVSKDKKPNTPKGVDWNSQLLVWDEANKEIEKGFNVGLVAGHNGHVIIDSDSEKLYQAIKAIGLPETYVEKTCSGGYHTIYILRGGFKNMPLNNNGEHLGEIRVSRCYVVVAPSVAVNKQGVLGGYEVVNDVPVAEIHADQLTELVKHVSNGVSTDVSSSFLNKEVFEAIDNDEMLKKLFNGEVGKFPSRSEAELSLVARLVSMNFDKEIIFQVMAKSKIGKWNESPLAYRNSVYDKAVSSITNRKKTIKEDVDFEVYSDTDLNNYEPPEQQWGVENIVPMGEVGILAGKRGEFKTWVGLLLSAALAAGNKFLDEKVHRKFKVFFIDAETGKPQIAKRWKMIKGGLGISNEFLDVEFLSFSGLKLDSTNPTFKRFKEHIYEKKPDFVIVDCFQRVVSFTVDKDNKEISELFTDIVRPIMNDIGCGWLFIHHLRKPLAGKQLMSDPLDEIRGGTELVNYARYVLSVSISHARKKDDVGNQLFVLKVLKMSNATIPDDKVVTVSMSEDGSSLTFTDIGLPSDVLSGEAQAANAIKEFLFENQLTSFKTGDILKAAKTLGFGASILKNALNILHDRGYLNKFKRGQWQLVVKSQQKLDGGDV